MLKAKALIKDKDKTRNLYIIGLNVQEIDRLMGGKTLVIETTELGMPDFGQIAILYGKTDNDIEAFMIKNGAKPREPF